MTLKTITSPPNAIASAATSSAWTGPNARLTLSEEEVFALLGKTPQPHVLYTTLDSAKPLSGWAKLEILKTAQERIKDIGPLSTPRDGRRSHDVQEFNAWMTVLQHLLPGKKDQWTMESFSPELLDSFVERFADAQGLTGRNPNTSERHLDKSDEPTL